MPSLHDLSDDTIPLDRRLALALAFAIGALNDATSFGIHILSPDTGRPLSSYRILAKLDPVLAEAKVALADASPADDQAAAAPKFTSAPERQAAVTAEAMLIFYDLLKGQPLHLAQPPVSVISDLITDPMLYARREPAVGGGAMIIALAHEMREMNINYQKHLHVTAVDIDAKCVHMAHLQFSLLQIPAIIVHGNSLTLEEFAHWYTPAHIMDGWDWRLRRHFGESANHPIQRPPEPAEPQVDAPPNPPSQLTLF